MYAALTAALYSQPYILSLLYTVAQLLHSSCNLAAANKPNSLLSFEFCHLRDTHKIHTGGRIMIS